MAEQTLTDEEKRAFDKQRADFFKGTIAVVVTYGTLIVIMSIIGFVNESARKLLFEDGFAFSVTLITGIILLVILLLIQVFTYNFKKENINEVSNITCPDYWELKKTPQSQLDLITDAKVKSLSKYYCEQKGANKDPIPITTIDSPSKELKALKSVADSYNNIINLSTQSKITCDRLYPDYMAYMDKKEFPSEPNKIRCEYIKQCGIGTYSNNNKIVWTSVCPTLS